MSLISLLESREITTGDYLMTLLVHLGVVLVSKDVNGTVFKSTNWLYRERHLRSLNDAIASSIADLLEIKTKVEMYQQGEAILMDFLKYLSVSRMSSLIAWAASSTSRNRIRELHLQGNIIAELHYLFVVAALALDPQADTTQEDKLDSGRSDVTIRTERTRVPMTTVHLLRDEDGSTITAASSSEASYKLQEDSQYQQQQHPSPHITIHEERQSLNVTAFVIVTLLQALFGVSLLSSLRVLGETGLVMGTLVYSAIVLAVWVWDLVGVCCKPKSPPIHSHNDPHWQRRTTRARVASVGRDTERLPHFVSPLSPPKIFSIY
eukprot:scaffold38183_cov57-Attheya_sp.AAC.1